MFTSNQPVKGDNLKQASQQWYAHWRKPIRNWIKKHSDAEMADFLIAIPDLFMLCVGLIGDARVPSSSKASLFSAIAYAISPIDLLPEAVMGAPGLIDDAGVLVLALHAVLRFMNVDPQKWQKILLQHWHGDGDPVSVILNLFSALMKNGKRLFGGLWRIFRRKHVSKSRRSRRKHYKSRRPRRVARYKTVPIT